jgi:hypothetical protein
MCRFGGHSRVENKRAAHGYWVELGHKRLAVMDISRGTIRGKIKKKPLRAKAGDTSGDKERGRAVMVRSGEAHEGAEEGALIGRYSCRSGAQKRGQT